MSYAGDGIGAWSDIEGWGAIVGIGTLLIDPGGTCTIGIEDGYVEMCGGFGESASGWEGLLLEGGDMKGDEGHAFVGEFAKRGVVAGGEEEEYQR